MKTAVIYARYSSDSQSEQSIEGQLRVCEEYAQRNDILILNTYIDRAMTGTNDHRPEFQKMLKDSNKREWNFVIVYKLDRFSRNKFETAMHKKTLKDNGVKILSAMENIPDTPEGIILESLLEGMAEYYSAELAQKVKRGMKETRLKGNFQGGYLLFGYKLDGRKIVINEDEAAIVRYLFEQYNAGKHVKTIIQELYAKGITNRGKPFARATVYDMLQNHKYTGVYQYSEEIIDNMFPQIISQELFNQVQAKSRKNKYGKRSLRVVYLLRNKLICGHCGNPMTAECGTPRNGDKISYYKCSGIKRFHNGCQKTTIQKDELENFVLNEIIKELSKPQNVNALLDYLMQLQTDLDNHNATLKILEREQRQAQNALDNVMRAVEQGIINKTTNKRMQELEDKIELLEKQILMERSKTVNKIPRERLAQYYAEVLRQDPVKLINVLIKEIRLYNDQMIIIINSLLNTSPDTNQGFFKHITKLKNHDTVKFTIEYFV